MLINDRRLDLLGCRFRKERMQTRLNISFEVYLTNPEHYDRIIEFMKKNKRNQVRQTVKRQFFLEGVNHAIH